MTGVSEGPRIALHSLRSLGLRHRPVDDSKPPESSPLGVCGGALRGVVSPSKVTRIGMVVSAANACRTPPWHPGRCHLLAAGESCPRPLPFCRTGFLPLSEGVHAYLSGFEKSPLSRFPVLSGSEGPPPPIDAQSALQGLSSVACQRRCVPAGRLRSGRPAGRGRRLGTPYQIC